MSHDDADVPDAERIADDGPRPTPLWALLSRWLLAAEAWLRSHGGPRLRWGIRGFWALIAAGGVLLLFGPVINKPLTLEDITSSASTATEQWIARHLTADYDVTRDDDGGLRVDVEERIEALFPDDVDESGIQRVLAVEYEGHALAPSDIEATLDGSPVEVRRSSAPDTLTLTMDAGERLVGDHEFVLTYTLRDLAYPHTDAATGKDVDLLEWDVFGPSWPQAITGLDVSVTLPDEIDAHLVRPPRGTIAWTLMGAGEWLEPEPDSPPGAVTYAFSNDQNLPPHAQARFSMTFEPGTFTMPPLTPLFWVQTFGPLAPLAFLAVTLLLALAARAVAWSDERGRPWFVAQFDPPAGVSARLAAHILRTPRTMELASALQQARNAGGDERRTRKAAAARIANRTGRWGDRFAASVRFMSAPERQEQLRRGLRRVPSGFVRDFFLAAPVALTLVQWGLVRQLSYQARLAVVWWPVAFVLLSTAVAFVVLGIAIRARPLTREGALVKQHLRGIEVYAERTQLLERAESTDRVLPYAVLGAPPREAGRHIRDTLAHELGDPQAGLRGWRTNGYLSWPALAVRGAAVLAVAAACAMVALLANPYDRHPDYATDSGDVPGILYTSFEHTELTAELSRDASGRAELAVTEDLQVVFDEESSRVPQLAQQWPNRIDGHDLGLEVHRVLVDGNEVPFATAPDADTLLMWTTMNDVLVGKHDVRIQYTLTSAAYAARGADGEVVDRVRWAALLEDWEYFWQWSDDPIDPQRVEFRLSDELADTASNAGWLTENTDAEEVRDWTETVIPFGSVAGAVWGLDDAPPAERTTESRSTEPGFDAFILELRHGESGYPFELGVTDTGVRLDFPAGTFTGPAESELTATETAAAVPLIVAVLSGGVALLLGLLGFLLRRTTVGLVTTRGTVRDLIRWGAPAAAIVCLIVFFWVANAMDGDDPAFWPFVFAAVAALVGGVAGWFVTRRRRTVTPSP
jgi:hypothetical protein